jgi:hypothetical protein
LLGEISAIHRLAMHNSVQAHRRNSSPRKPIIEKQQPMLSPSAIEAEASLCNGASVRGSRLRRVIATVVAASAGVPRMKMFTMGVRA